MSSSVRREDRLEIRLSRATKQLLKRAASAQRKTVATFVIENSAAAAADVLAEQREFRLATKDYDAFVAALDGPVREKPRLEKLLKTRSAAE